MMLYVFNKTWSAYKIVISSDSKWLKDMGFNKESFFPNRLRKRAQHTLEEWKALRGNSS